MGLGECRSDWYRLNEEQAWLQLARCMSTAKYCARANPTWSQRLCVRLLAQPYEAKDPHWPLKPLLVGPAAPCGALPRSRDYQLWWLV
jgi:hypothetical protein